MNTRCRQKSMKPAPVPLEVLPRVQMRRQILKPEVSLAKVDDAFSSLSSFFFRPQGLGAVTEKTPCEVSVSKSLPFAAMLMLLKGQTFLRSSWKAPNFLPF